MKNKIIYCTIAFLLLIVSTFIGIKIAKIYVKRQVNLALGQVGLVKQDVIIQNIKDLYNYKSLILERIPQLDFIPPKNLALGNIEMLKHKVIFTGISRDNAPFLPFVMRHMEALGELFADYKVIIFENDSTDATKFILHQWQSINPKVKILSEDFLTKKRPSILFLAEVRNKYIVELNKPEFNDFDIVIPMDMDMGYGIDFRGVEDSFSKYDRWDVVCSNGIYNAAGNMCDAFAFRNTEFPESPAEYFINTNKNYLDTYNRLQKIYPPNTDLMPVESCFGGLAIYKKQFLKNCFYDSIGEDCEHVYLHKCMREKNSARIFMNPAQIIRYEYYR